MSLLRDGAVRRDQPRFARNQQLMHRLQGRWRHLRRSDLQAGAKDRIELPCRHHRDDTRLKLDMRDLAGRAPLDQNPPRAPPVKRMPAIVDDDSLPDMGRMTARLLWAETMRRCGLCAVADPDGQESGIFAPHCAMALLDNCT